MPAISPISHVPGRIADAIGSRGVSERAVVSRQPFGCVTILANDLADGSEIERLIQVRKSAEPHQVGDNLERLLPEQGGKSATVIVSETRISPVILGAWLEDAF